MSPGKRCTILGIESSCDETAASVVVDAREVKSNVIATQFELHEEYGGVVPEIASRAHIERILPVIREALVQAGIDEDEANERIDAIAVGHCPGLIGSLLVGVSAAKALAWAWGKPLIGVDHVMAHLYAGALDVDDPPRYPAIGLIVSGGHTTLCGVNDSLDVRVLGRTIDDAIGEAYDKAAMMLGLGFPGGRRVDERAQRGDDRKYDFPISRLGAESLDFSYSGLKTSLLYMVRGKPAGKGKERKFERDYDDLTEREVDDLCASFQRAAIGAVMLKLKRAIDSADGDGVKSLIVGGGVSANSRLRAEVRDLAKDRGLDLHLPAIEYCLDNGAMIAGLGGVKFARKEFDDLSLSPMPAGSLR